MSEAESAETNQAEREEVEAEGEAVVDGVPPGQAGPALQLLQHKVHPPLPLHVLALLVSVLQLGPDVVEVVKELLQTNYQMREGGGVGRWWATLVRPEPQYSGTVMAPSRRRARPPSRKWKLAAGRL